MILKNYTLSKIKPMAKFLESVYVFMLIRSFIFPYPLREESVCGRKFFWFLRFFAQIRKIYEKI